MNRFRQNKTTKVTGGRNRSFHPQVETLEYRRLLAFSSELAIAFLNGDSDIPVEDAQPEIAVLSGESDSSARSNLASKWNSASWLDLFQSRQNPSSSAATNVTSNQPNSDGSDSFDTLRVSIIYYFASQPYQSSAEPTIPDGAKPRRPLIDDDTPEGLPPDAVAVESPSRSGNLGRPSITPSQPQEPIPSKSPASETSDADNASASFLRAAGRLVSNSEVSTTSSENDSEEYGGLISINHFDRSRPDLSNDVTETPVPFDDRFDVSDDVSDEVVDELIAEDDWQYGRSKQSAKEESDTEKVKHHEHQRHRRRKVDVETKQDGANPIERVPTPEVSEFGGMISIEPQSHWSDDSRAIDRSFESVGLADTIFSEVGNAQAFGFLDSQDNGNLETEIGDVDDSVLSDRDTGPVEFSSAAVILPFYWYGYRARQKTKRSETS